MEWNSGFSSLYELRAVDPLSFRDAEPMEFSAGTISRTGSGLVESADLTMPTNPGERLIRIYLRARQEADSSRNALFTGLTSSPERKLDGERITYNVDCYSVLKPVDDVLIRRGYYAPAGADAANIVADLLSVGPAPVVIDDRSPYLTETIVAEDSMSRLDVAWLILDAIGWRLRIDGDGTVHICAPAQNASAAFDTMENDVMELSITDTQDWYSVPNCIRVISGSSFSEFIDDDPSSPISTVARRAVRGGTGEIWMADTAASLGDNESLAEYALRVLREAQEPARTISYARRFRPNVVVTDLVAIHLPGVGIDGIYKVTSQTIELGYGCRTSEEVVEVG